MDGGDASGARVETPFVIICVDAADRDDGNLYGSTNFSQVREALRRTELPLGWSIKNGAEKDVACASGFGSFRVFEAVARNSHQKFLWSISSLEPGNCFTCGQSVAAQVKTMRIGSQSDVKPPVHDHSTI